MGTIGQCSSDNIYGRKMMASWTASDITSLLPPTASPTSSVTYLSGYLTTNMYGGSSVNCTDVHSALTIKLGECITTPSFSYASLSERTDATSNIITTMFYSDALCQRLFHTTYDDYEAGVCKSGKTFEISSKVTADRTVPRVTQM
jgi:hypothetical protein